jgi:hypothetical protein
MSNNLNQIVVNDADVKFIITLYCIILSYIVFNIVFFTQIKGKKKVKGLYAYNMHKLVDKPLN